MPKKKRTACTGKSGQGQPFYEKLKQMKGPGYINRPASVQVNVYQPADPVDNSKSGHVNSCGTISR